MAERFQTIGFVGGLFLGFGGMLLMFLRLYFSYDYAQPGNLLRVKDTLEGLTRSFPIAWPVTSSLIGWALVYICH